MPKKTHMDRKPVLLDVLQAVPQDYGTYALVYACEAPFEGVAGKLGPVFLSAGYWIYVGSAFGPGGLRSRLAHHLKPSLRLHWHLDYIKSSLRPLEIWITTDTVKREHAWAEALSTLKGASRPLVGFGASDCTCRSHLIRLPRRPGFSTFNKKIRRRIASHGPLIKRLCP